MKLTNKCKEDFYQWYKNRLSVMSYSELLNINDETVYNALIVEFFDAQKIFINIKSKFGNRKERERFSYSLFSFSSGFMWDSRQEALNEAIVNANNFYNKNR